MLPVITIFLLYFFLLIFIIRKLGFVKRSGLSVQTISILFLGKIIAGIFSCWYALDNSGDLLASFNNSLEQTAILKSKPMLFFSSTFKTGYANYEGLYSSHSFWNDLRYIFMDKLLAVLNLISFSNIYVNVLIYNAVIFLGHIAVYRVFISIWPNKKPAIIAGCFLLPSSLFFLSSVNKDSVFFFASAIVIYALYKMPELKWQYLKPKWICLLITGLLLMFVIRNFFLMAALQAVLVYYLYPRINIKPVYFFTAWVLIMVVAVLSSETIMHIISSRQNEFLKLGNARSLVEVPILKPDIKSFLEYFTISFQIIFFKPSIWDSYNIYFFLGSLEIHLYQVLIIAAIFFKIKNKIKIVPQRLGVFGVFFSLTAFIIIGYTIPYIGAVVRYKSAFLPFFITPLLCFLPLKQLSNNCSNA